EHADAGPTGADTAPRLHDRRGARRRDDPLGRRARPREHRRAHRAADRRGRRARPRGHPRALALRGDRGARRGRLQRDRARGRQRRPRLDAARHPGAVDDHAPGEQRHGGRRRHDHAPARRRHPQLRERGPMQL
ncbi:MAG: hypothetical protein AVDCRST_MAG79-299, partial [uncultured Thermoleophilia bacterium]